jgi:hypothetical protein
MKRVFRGGALVALIAILIAPAIYADDPSSPADPPSARMRPPVGSEAHREQSTVFELFRAWLQARIGIPID